MEAPQHEAFKKLPTSAVELLINVGIMNSVSEHWPEDVQERWTERIEGMIEWVDQQIAEVQEFASSFD